MYCFELRKFPFVLISEKHGDLPPRTGVWSCPAVLSLLGKMSEGLIMDSKRDVFKVHAPYRKNLEERSETLTQTLDGTELWERRR